MTGRMAEPFPLSSTTALLRCPGCACDPEAGVTPVPAPRQQAPACPECGRRTSWFGEVRDFIDTAEPEAGFQKVNQFYEARPFPGYAPGETASSLIDRCRSSPFMEALDRAIPHDALVLDCGCGTGQIPNFLALAGPRRTVIGVDGCRASLTLADGFRSKVGTRNLRFLRGDLFALPVQESRFDVVISRGVVHHTPEPYRATAEVARRVRPDGVLVVAFYESMGRAFHRMRQHMTRAFKNPPKALDPVLRRNDLDPEKKRTWVADQYEHPLEHCLPFPRVTREVEALGFRWIRSLPPAVSGDGMFDATDKPGAVQMSFRRVGWMMAGLRDQDAGMACLVARRVGSASS